MKPLFSNSSTGCNKITLIENGEVTADDRANAESFNELFIEEVSSLAIEEHLALLDDADEVLDPVKRAVKKVGHHTSIIDIKRNVSITTKFSFIEVVDAEMITEINKLDAKKAATFNNIPVRGGGGGIPKGEEPKLTLFFSSKNPYIFGFPLAP